VDYKIGEKYSDNSLEKETKFKKRTGETKKENLSQDDLKIFRIRCDILDIVEKIQNGVLLKDINISEGGKISSLCPTNY
jgi:hypothetical protein